MKSETLTALDIARRVKQPCSVVRAAIHQLDIKPALRLGNQQAYALADVERIERIIIAAISTHGHINPASIQG